jgi:predicted SnoaL-like aldol condensation-catalyzing enzyme
MYVQLENKWFKLNKGENLISKVGVDGFWLLVNLLKKRTYQNEVIFNKQLICKYFGGMRTEYSKLAYEAVKKLTENNIIKLLVEIDFNKPDKKDFIVAEVNFDVTFKNNYFMLNDEEINIISNTKKISKPKLLALFCALKYRLFDGQCSYISLGTLYSETKISKTTIKKYIDKLQEIGLIKYQNPGRRQLFDNTIKESPNFYVLSSNEHWEYILNKEIENYKNKQINNGTKFI